MRDAGTDEVDGLAVVTQRDRRGAGLERGDAKVGTIAAQDEYVQFVGSLEDIEAMPDAVWFEVVAAIRPDIDVDAAGRMRLPSDEIFTGCRRRVHDGTPFGVS